MSVHQLVVQRSNITTNDAAIISKLLAWLFGLRHQRSNQGVRLGVECAGVQEPLHFCRSNAVPSYAKKLPGHQLWLYSSEPPTQVTPVCIVCDMYVWGICMCVNMYVWGICMCMNMCMCEHVCVLTCACVIMECVHDVYCTMLCL